MQPDGRDKAQFRLQGFITWMSLVFMAALPIGHCLANDQAGAGKAQLTIYVDRPLLETGGTVMAVSKPVGPDLWSVQPKGLSTDTWKQNPKRLELGSNDRLFEVHVSEKVSIIEFIYPQGGSFGFNLVAAPGGDLIKPLQSKRILVGSGYYIDRETGEKQVWEDVSTIHILGPDVSEGYSRAVRMASGELMNAHPRRETGIGTVVHIPSAETLAKVVVTEAN